MLQYLFDTDHLTLLEHYDVRVWQRFLRQTPGDVGLSVISLEESLRGRLGVVARRHTGPPLVTAYANLLEIYSLFQHFLIVPFDLPCENLFQHLRGQRIRIGTQDLRIAAIALVNQIPLVTRNRRDFAQVPGLTLQDWSV